MTLPRKIKVGGATYKFKKGRRFPEDAGFFGLTDFDTRTIYLAKAPPPVIASTIVHEVIHAALDVAGISPKAEERIARALEAPILSFIVENKALIAWLQEAAKK